MSDLLQNILSGGQKNKKRQRLGRGEGSKGKTSGRGQKGAGSRAGSSKRIGFEGGQTEIYRRFPQRGFSNKPFETRYHVVNLSALERFDDGATVDQTALKQAGLIPNTHQSVKILGNGELSKKLTVIAGSFSRSAHQAITAKGGTAQNEKGEAFEFSEPRNRRLSRKLDKRLERLGLPARETTADAQGSASEKPAKGKKKAASARPDGQSGDVTEAPESGTKDSGSVKSEGGTTSSSSPTEAPESGDRD